MADNHTYTNKFFAHIDQISLISARRVVPVLIDLVRPSSVIDIGCGTGGWLAAFAEQGIIDVIGMDGDYVDRAQLRVPANCFTAHDLNAPIKCEREFDLALSVEVGEHLNDTASRRLVQDLTALAPVVAFSAAVPGQGGINHVNEQWPKYWVDCFAAAGFIAVDAVRPRIWDDDHVAWYYRQNLIIYVCPDCISNYPILERAHSFAEGRKPLSLVHPGMYAGLRYQTRPENQRVTDAAKLFASSIGAAISRRVH